jgi:transposase-like protein
MQFSGGIYNSTQKHQNTPKMAHKHHAKEARIWAVQQHDGGRPASEICKEMNISPATLKRWRDQLHLLAPPDAAKMREQEKTIEHMARIVINQSELSASCPFYLQAD